MPGVPPLPEFPLLPLGGPRKVPPILGGRSLAWSNEGDDGPIARRNSLPTLDELNAPPASLQSARSLRSFGLGRSASKASVGIREALASARSSSSKYRADGDDAAPSSGRAPRTPRASSRCKAKDAVTPFKDLGEDSPRGDADETGGGSEQPPAPSQARPRGLRRPTGTSLRAVCSVVTASKAAVKAASAARSVASAPSAAWSAISTPRLPSLSARSPRPSALPNNDVEESGEPSQLRVAAAQAADKEASMAEQATSSTSSAATFGPKTPRSARVKRRSKEAEDDALQPASGEPDLDKLTSHLICAAYQQSLPEEMVAAVEQMCPEVRWLAQCAMSAPVKEGSKRRDGDVAIGKEATNILALFVHMAKCVLHARQAPENAGRACVQLRKLKDDCAKDLQKASTGWTGPYEAQNGGEYWHNTLTGISSWRAPAAAENYAHQVVERLLSCDAFPKVHASDVARSTSKEAATRRSRPQSARPLSASRARSSTPTAASETAAPATARAAAPRADPAPRPEASPATEAKAEVAQPAAASNQSATDAAAALASAAAAVATAAASLVNAASARAAPSEMLSARGDSGGVGVDPAQLQALVGAMAALSSATGAPAGSPMASAREDVVAPAAADSTPAGAVASTPVSAPASVDAQGAASSSSCSVVSASPPAETQTAATPEIGQATVATAEKAPDAPAAAKEHSSAPAEASAEAAAAPRAEVTPLPLEKIKATSEAPPASAAPVATPAAMPPPPRVAPPPNATRPGPPRAGSLPPPPSAAPAAKEPATQAATVESTESAQPPQTKKEPRTGGRSKRQAGQGGA